MPNTRGKYYFFSSSTRLYTFQLNTLQSVLLETRNRVLLTLPTVTRGERFRPDPPRVSWKHHPIALLEEKENSVVLMHSSCEAGRTAELTNVFKDDSWRREFSVDAMHLERLLFLSILKLPPKRKPRRKKRLLIALRTVCRTCNRGRAPLHGKTLRVAANDVYPSVIADSAGEIRGGVEVQYLEVVAEAMGFRYALDHNIESVVYLNGTPGGGYGDVTTNTEWHTHTRQLPYIFTCGRRPTGHVMMALVVVVVGGGGGGGEQLLYMGPPRAHVWSSKIQKKDPLFFIFFSKVHVWIKCPCMADSRSKEGEGGPSSF